MIKNLLYILAAIVITHSQYALAHDGGHELVTESHAIEIAYEVTTQFIENDPGLGFGKLSNSWKKLPINAGRVHQKGKGFYIISLTNEKEGKSLYVLMSVTGDVYDANLSGKFEGLN